MKIINDLRKKQTEKTNKLFTDCLVFWAFSNEQFEQNKTKLEDGEKYVSMGAGGYIPKSKVETLQNGIKEINKWFKAATKDSKTRVANILYELNNHEAYYTGDINATLDALGSDYTHEEVLKVYRDNHKAHWDKQDL